MKTLRFSKIQLSLLVMMLASAHSNAQYVSTRSVILSNRGDRQLVCATEQGDMLQYNRDMIADNHKFVLHTPGATSAAQFEFTPPITMQGSHEYAINDMRVLGDWCYFCGSKAVPAGNVWNGIGWVTQYDSVGFIGRFSLQVFSASSGADQIEIAEIRGSLTLDRMACINYNTGIQIALVGTADDAYRTSCIVGVTRQSSTWAYRIKTASNLEETFTDIAITEKQAAAVSRRYGDLWDFNLRCGYNSDWFYSLDMSELDTRYDFYTYQCVTVPYPPRHLTIHDNDAMIRICNVLYDDQLDLAYESSLSGSGYSTALFNIELQRPLSMRYAQYVDSVYHDPGRFLDMRHVFDGNSVALLYAEPDNAACMSALLLPNWNGTAAVKMPFAHNAIRAVDISGTDDIYLAGSLSTQQQVHLTQNMSALVSSGETCHSVEPLKTLELKQVRPTEVDDPLFNFLYKLFTWNTYTGDKQTIGENNRCLQQ